MGGQNLYPMDYDVDGRLTHMETKLSEFQDQMAGTQAFQYPDRSFSDPKEVEDFLNKNWGDKPINLSHFPDSVLVWTLAAP